MLKDGRRTKNKSSSNLMKFSTANGSEIFNVTCCLACLTSSRYFSFHLLA